MIVQDIIPGISEEQKDIELRKLIALILKKYPGNPVDAIAYLANCTVMLKLLCERQGIKVTLDPKGN